MAVTAEARGARPAATQPQERQTIAAWAKIGGRPHRGIPCATYNLHPFGRHGTDASYAPVLERVAATATMLVKHDVARTPADARHLETAVEHSAQGQRCTVTWHTPAGPLRSVTLTPPGQPAYVVEHFVKSAADVQRVLSTRPGQVRFDLAPTRRLLETVAGRGILYVSYPDPMYSVASLFDIQVFVLRCVTEPEPIQALIEHEAAVAEDYVERLAAACAGLPLLFYTAGPEVATPPLLPPAVFRRFVTPHQKRLVAIFHRHGHLVGIHCHGRVRQVLDEILDTGADLLEPIEPPDQGDIGLRELLDRVRGRLCLLGHIQDQEFYRDEPGLLRRRVGEVAAQVDPADRYVMAPTCTPFQFPASAHYVRAYSEWLEAAAELLPASVTGTACTR